MKLWHVLLLLCICIAICSLIKWAFILILICLAIIIYKIMKAWFEFTNCDRRNK